MRYYMLQKILILYSFLILWLILVAKVHIIFGFIKCVASIVFENVNYLYYLTLEELFANIYTGISAMLDN